MKTKLHFSSRAPWSASWATDSLLIYDRALLRFPASARWIRRFPKSYGVKAGEDLKDLRAFPGHLEKIHRLAGALPNRRLSIIVAGGGSVGDFGGFVAMVFKRGVRLVHVPTTWLAAVDSAHGGKNGLNVAGTKNQIGGIHPAQDVYLVKEFLASQSEERAVEAAGEVLKIALLKGGLKVTWKAGSASDSLWRALPAVIRGKMSIVDRDPFEKSGIRHLLNLGHTMGHVFEAELKIPHGWAVALGLIFAVTYSRSAGVCSEREHEKMIAQPLWSLFLPSEAYAEAVRLPEKSVRRRLLQDKKRTKKDLVRFIFLKGMGRPEIREVSVGDLLKELRRQRQRLESLGG